MARKAMIAPVAFWATLMWLDAEVLQALANARDLLHCQGRMG